MKQANARSHEPYRSLLEERSAQLRREIREEMTRSGDERYVDISGQGSDSGDESVASLLADLGVALVDRQVVEIREIDAAFARMAEDTYGTCIECGAEIGTERLKAYPTAARCIDCQTQREKTYMQEGKPTL
jgi:DnaK suppressor protein